MTVTELQRACADSSAGILCGANLSCPGSLGNPSSDYSSGLTHTHSSLDPERQLGHKCGVSRPHSATPNRKFFCTNISCNNFSTRSRFRPSRKNCARNGSKFNLFLYLSQQQGTPSELTVPLSKSCHYFASTTGFKSKAGLSTVSNSQRPLLLDINCFLTKQLSNRLRPLPLSSREVFASRRHIGPEQ